MEEIRESSIHGLSRESEEKQLKETIHVAQQNLDRTKSYIKELSDELHEMLETYGAKDKEALTLWHNTQSQLQENEKDLVRCEKARKKPYFGRIDFKDPKMSKEESYYIGRVGITKNGSEPMVIDWRAPVASVYYENSTGPCQYRVRNEGTYEIDLRRKRTYEIANDTLIDFFDSDVVANDDLLTKYLAKSKKAVLGEIIATIQQEQNAIIRKSPKTNLIVQGVAGSGKTTVAMHRISYILYNYEQFRPEDFYIIGSNRILLDYITSVLPDLDVYGVSQMTMEELFVRLLYEDWDAHVYKISPINKKDKAATKKGTYEWFHDLEEFCRDYEKSVIPGERVCIEKNGVVLMEEERIASVLTESQSLSMQEKIGMLNEILLSKLENELIGKNVSYTKEEKRQLRQKCRFHFGKPVFKESVFSMYQEFIKVQAEKGKKVRVRKKSYDVYDLAALAYLYKRIKETDGIREASHVIIDEAQDFGMMAYAVLKYCLRGCTYTIMGDVSQNIQYGYGLNDWEELRKLMLRGSFDSFGLLKKSYRNTVEISNFATDILRHGNFAVYPVEPIIRHGNEVRIASCNSEEELLYMTAETIASWQKEGHETVAVICSDEEEALAVTKKLSKRIEVTDSSLKTAEFGSGVMVLPVEYTKGLEFDAVLLYDPSKDKYPESDPHVKLLYVAATRALHELAVLYQGSLTELIKTSVSKEKRMQSLEKKSDTMKKEVRKERVKREEAPKEEIIKKNEAPLKEQEAADEKVVKDEERAAVKKPEPRKEEEKKEEEKKEEVLQSVLSKRDKEKINASTHRFLAVADAGRMRPPAAAKESFPLCGARKTKRHIDLLSKDGILRITPVMDGMVRVQFRLGTECNVQPAYWDCLPSKPVAWNVKAEKDKIMIVTKALVITVQKETGAITFFDRAGNLLLAEQAALPRKVRKEEGVEKAWNYFDWPASEKLFAKGVIDEDLEPLSKKARYISFGQKKMRMPLIVSNNGYGIGVASEDAAMCCDIPMYGTYVYTEGMPGTDYYFIYGKERKRTLRLYREITK